MSLPNILQLSLAACVGVAFLSNLIIYFAFKAHGVQTSLSASLKSGYVENLYKQTPALQSPLLSITIRLASWSKIFTVVVAVAYIVLRAVSHS